MADENKKDKKKTEKDVTDTVDKEALKAQKKVEKEALKAKKERIKQSKPKKDKGNIFVRMGKAIKKFFKDFRGTCKKVVWPDGKTVMKNSGIVLLTVVIIGAGIWIIDFAFSKGIRGVQSVIKNAGAESSTVEEETTEASGLSSLLSGLTTTTSAATTTASSGETTTAATTAAETTTAATTAATTTAATTTAAAQ